MSKGTATGTKVGGTSASKAAFAVFAVAIMTLSVAVVAVNNQDGGGDKTAYADDPAAYSTSIRYNANGGTVGDAAAPALTVGYYGIAATEYNPEVWKGSVTGTGDIYSNWTGPRYDCDDITKSISFKVTFYVKNNTTYTINLPNVTGEITTTLNPTNNVAISNTSGCGSFTYGSENTDTPASTDTSFKFKSTAETVKMTIALTCTVYACHKVFAGWSTSAEGDDTIYPGDVVSTTVGATKDLYAKWTVPDLFVAWGDVLSLNIIGATSYTLDVITPYANISHKVNNDTMERTDGKLELVRLDYSGEGTDSGTHNGRYTEVIPGSERTAPDIFGTIYHLARERTVSKDDSNYWLNFRGVSGYLGTFPGGTYRASGTYAEKVQMILSSNQSTNVWLNGDIAIDSIGLRTAGKPGSHGDGDTNTIFANGHVLILGTGIHNSYIDSATASKPQDVAGGYLLPQIFGGTYKTNITEAAVTSKVPVTSRTDDGMDTMETVNLGTFVIVHSGYYSNIVGGSFANGGTHVTIGTSESPLSTYIVLKGGTVTDTVAGGFGGNGKSTVYGMSDGDTPSKEVGGSFIYALGCNMPADTYEEKASGWNTDDRAKYTLLESSILEGGSSRSSQSSQLAAVQGSTHVFVSGTATLWDVQAGGRTQYTHSDYAYMEVSGRSVIRHVACGTITDGAYQWGSDTVNTVDLYVHGDAVVSNIYGAGYDTWDSPANRSMLTGEINVTVAGGHVNNVYGGGYRGSIGDGTLTVNVNVTGGEVHGNVYGGGSGGVDKILHNTDGTPNSRGGGCTYSMGKSVIFGDVNVTIGGTAVVDGNVYGGGMSVPRLSSYTAGSTTLSFDSESTNRYEVIDNVRRYYEVADVFGDVKVTLKDTCVVKGSVFGAGRSVEVAYDGANYTYPDMTATYTVGSPCSAESPNYTTIPWMGVYDSSTEKVTYSCTYDNSLCLSGSGGTGIQEGCRYLNFAKIHGNATVVIDQDSGGYVAGDIYAGGAFGKVDGNTAIEFDKGTAQSDVFGGGLGREGINSVSGTRTVIIRGDDEVANTATHYSGVRIEGSVYGGSANGNDGPIVADTETSGYTDTSVVIHRGYIKNDVFGGGLMGKTYGNATVYIGYEAEYDRTIGKYVIAMCTNQTGHKIAIDNVYAGGNVSTEYDDDGKPVGIDPFKKYLVMGKGTVRVYGDGGTGDIAISGSIMASGNSCLTGYNGAATAIELEGFHNTADSMTGIHRADTLRMTQTLLNISGRSPLVPIGDTEKILSVYGIGTMIMRYDSHIFVDKPMDCIGEFQSLSKDNKATTVTSPSNEITFTTGSTFYVRGTNLIYGAVTGYAVLSVESQDRYGAYVLGDAALSTGGFVLHRDGSYVRADFNDSNDIRCWYISGVQKKVVTMNLPAEEDENRDPVLKSVAASVEIQKLQDGTDIRYTGGSFTAVSSEGTDMYHFVRPGVNPTTGEKEEYDGYADLGMVIGYLADDAEKTAGTMYSIDSRYLNIGSGDTWMYGSYFTEDENDKGTEYIRGGSGTIDKPVTPSTMAHRSDVGNKAAGLYTLGLVFCAAHSDRTTYIGYLILNLQESRTVQYETIENGVAVVKENVMVTNKIEIRADLYVTASESSDLRANYDVIMKTDIPSTTSRGTVDVMIPTGMNNGVVTLDGI